MNAQKCSVAGAAMSLGLVTGLGLLLWTLLVVFVPEAGGRMLGSFDGFLGYTVSVPGAFLIALYGFIDGAIGGALLAMFYNFFAGAK